MIQKMYRFIKEHIVLFLFNNPLLVKEIENMSVEEYRKKATASLKVETVSGGPEIYSLFSYKDPLVRTLVLNMKYRRNRAFFSLAGKLVYQELIEILEELNLWSYFIDPIIVPVPISNKKRRERGYNQTEEILKNLKGFEVRNDLVKKTTHTKNQTGLSGKERKKNLKDAFVVINKQHIAGRNIIIFDDVITTGTTITEIAQTLKKAGARKVVALTIAH